MRTGIICIFSALIAQARRTAGIEARLGFGGQAQIVSHRETAEHLDSCTVVRGVPTATQGTGWEFHVALHYVGTGGGGVEKNVFT